MQIFDCKTRGLESWKGVPEFKYLVNQSLNVSYTIYLLNVTSREGPNNGQ